MKTIPITQKVNKETAFGICVLLASGEQDVVVYVVHCDWFFHFNFAPFKALHRVNRACCWASAFSLYEGEIGWCLKIITTTENQHKQTCVCMLWSLSPALSRRRINRWKHLGSRGIFKSPELILCWLKYQKEATTGMLNRLPYSLLCLIVLLLIVLMLEEKVLILLCTSPGCSSFFFFFFLFKGRHDESPH